MGDAGARPSFRIDGSCDPAAACPKDYRSDHRDVVCLAAGDFAASHLLQPVRATVCGFVVLRRLRNMRVLFVVDDGNSTLEVPVQCLCYCWPLLSPYGRARFVRATRVDIRASILATHTRSRILESEGRPPHLTYRRRPYPAAFAADLGRLRVTGGESSARQ